MPSGYHHLTYEQRCQIYTLCKRGESQREIAAEIGCSASSVSRELKRNSGGRGYRFKQAQRLAAGRRRAASSVPRKMTRALWDVVEDRLALGWSPEQIAGRLDLEGVVSVSFQWIYRHVWDDRARGGGLYLNLRRRGKKRNRRGRDGAGRGVIPGRVDISARPGIVEDKRRIGDWEVDTVIGSRQRGALVSAVERASKFTFLELVASKTASAVEAALARCLGPVSALVHTLTADNGKEFANHVSVARTLSASFFFATPYHAWERGLNEHTNGLVRQYFPKSTDFREVSAASVKQVQEALNNRPRRVLGYRTPAEVFHQAQPP